MNEEIAIRVNDVKKSFKIYYDKNKTLKDLLATPTRSQHKRRDVLNGISFEVKRGEAIALIGKNGCGKSTMLKMLTKIIYPDSGSIEVNGKVSSLLELGAGFHPDMSGRENIYLNASVFGLTKRQIDKKVDEIIEFSELEKFIDNPVRTYSSGMYMRLAFSVAINVQAEILLIDEILGVGDVSFQKKCFNRLKRIKESGTTIVIVSHSMSQIEEICDRCIWIYEGLIKEVGNPKLVGAHYYQLMESERLERLAQEKLESSEKKEVEEVELEITKVEKKRELPAFCGKHAKRTCGEKVYFNNVILKNQMKEETLVFYSDDELRMEMEIISTLDQCRANLEISIYNEDQICCYRTDFWAENQIPLEIQAYNKISVDFNSLQLLKGEYFICIGVYSETMEILDEIRLVKEFSVRSRNQSTEKGIFHMEHTWQVQ